MHSGFTTNNLFVPFDNLFVKHEEVDVCDNDGCDDEDEDGDDDNEGEAGGRALKPKPA